METIQLIKKIKGFQTKVTDEELAVDISVPAFAPWSYSKMKMLRKCPLQFYLKYVLKVKLTEERKVNQTSVGKAAHRIIELILTGKTISKAFSLAKAEYSSELTEEEWERDVESLELSITSFKEKLDEFAKTHKIKRFLQEIQVAVTKDWEPTGFWSEDCFFRGVIDLVVHISLDEKDTKFDAMFLDHKTGAPAVMGLRPFQGQLDSYKVLFHHGISEIEGAVSGVHYIRDSEIKLGDYDSKEKIETTLKGDLEFTLESGVELLKEIGYFKHIAGSQCKWCDYSAQCKSKLLKDIELDSKKWFKINQV